jgi:uncharacterized protein (DUF2267 family)
MSEPVSAFENTLRESHEWLNDLAARGRYADERQAYAALRAVLQSLRDRLTVNESADLAAQFPMLIRGLFYEGWRPATTPLRERTRNEFLDHVRERLPYNHRNEAERDVRAVFDLLSRRITQGELRDVRAMLPEAVRGLWPVEPAAASVK